MFRGIGRGIRIRTLNDGVRVRSVTVTLYLCVELLPACGTANTAECFIIISHYKILSIGKAKKYYLMFVGKNGGGALYSVNSGADYSAGIARTFSAGVNSAYIALQKFIS